jgi:ArsR family transcriptional regulator
LRLDHYFVEWLIGNMSNIQTLRALANERRLQILTWLKDPVAHFPPQADGDLRKDGVCGLFIAEKLGLSQPTASEHLRILTQAGLVRAKRIKQWTLYRRNEAAIASVKRAIEEKV